MPAAATHPRSSPPGFLLCVVVLLAGSAASARAAGVDFLRDVRPILSSHCFKCHGPDENTRKGGLRLDIREEALKPAKSDAVAILPGKASESELVKRILTDDEDELMPPASTKHPLTAAQKEILQRWIDEGAEYRPHWAFVPPAKAELPAGPAHPVDAFIRERLRKEGLEPAPEADRATLVRRVWLDLTGLPPTPEEADAFLRDERPDAYERLVDRLLASEHYGERWARRWMDLARYADTNGYEKDRVRSMWPWRDWLIGAFNADLPFDRFTVEQIAGDMLPGATADQRVATGFHRNTMINEEGGIDPLEYRYHAMVDRVHTTATTWLGLTLSCAQCHTHKYDPIQHREYFQFMAFLDNADEPVMDVPRAEITERRRELLARIDALEARLPESFPPEDTAVVTAPPAEGVDGGAVERLADGSYRFSGPVPDKATYTFSFRGPLAGVSYVTVEVLADATLPRNGPGRSGNGNFVLSEIQFERVDASGVASTAVAVSEATADFEQQGFPVRNALDGKPDTGWGIAGEGAWNLNRMATFRFAEPLVLGADEQVRVRLAQEYGGKHVIGRVRLGLGVERPDTRSLAERRQANFERRYAAWKRREADRVRSWTVLQPLVATSTVPVLTIESDGSVFASSDQTKSDWYDVRLRGGLKGITAIRLEALTDPRLPRQGPGRVYYEGPFGDFFLSSLRISAGENDLKLVRPSQSHASGGNDAAKALDDDLQSGWSIDGGQGRRQVAVFNLESPLEGADELRLRMLFEKYYAAGLGRFRLSATTDPRGAEASPLPEELETALARGDGLSPEEDAALRRFCASVAPELAPAREEIRKLRNQMPAYPTTLVMEERPPNNPRTTLQRHRGEFLQPKDPVQARLPEVLAVGLQAPPTNRLQFARWLVARENPLTARVVVNRQWQAFFGRGLVRTMEDFGFQGELPTHPELLDWLAVEFMDRGWSMKALNRLLVTSATYRQSSRVTPESLEKDPQNLWLARAPRFRLEGELVRDLALSASGLLSRKLGGPSVFPPQLASITKEGAYGPLDWVVSQGEDRYRRGLYTFAKRTAPYATFQTFDAPSGEACVARREVSNTPLQSLTLLNDEVFVEAAQALGRKAAALEGGDEARARYLFQRCLTRVPREEELRKVLAFLEAQRERLADGELQAAALAGAEGPAALDQAAWMAVARALLNLDETVSRG